MTENYWINSRCKEKTLVVKLSNVIHIQLPPNTDLKNRHVIHLRQKTIPKNFTTKIHSINTRHRHNHNVPNANLCIYHKVCTLQKRVIQCNFVSHSDIKPRYKEIFQPALKAHSHSVEDLLGQAWETWAQYGGAPHSSVTVRFPWLYRRARYFRVVLWRL